MTEIRPMNAEEIAHATDAKRGGRRLPETAAVLALAEGEGVALEGHVCSKGRTCGKAVSLTMAARAHGFRITTRHSLDKTILYVVRLAKEAKAT